jgi:hypothetical protein
MSLNFPATPTVGQLYPVPALAGVPQYVWDGAAWNIPTPDYLVLTGCENLAINGFFDVAQEFGIGTVAATDGKYVMDQWMTGTNGGTLSAVSANPTSAPTSGNQLGFVSGSSIAIGAGNYEFLMQLIEGTRWSRLRWGTTAAVSINVSFWIYAAVAGNYAVAVRNAAVNRSYVASFTVNAATTWEYKSITIPGDVTGTWPNDTAPCANICVVGAAGTTYQTATPNAWTAANMLGFTGMSSAYGVSSGGFYLSAFVIVPGSVGPTEAQSRASIFRRSYAEELLLCCRYWERGGMTMSIMSGTYDNTCWYKAQKRATPTITLISGGMAGGSVGVMAAVPLDGFRQITNPSGAIDAGFSINARM